MSKKENTNNKKSKKINKQTIYVILAMICIISYTVFVLIANFHDHTVQSELTVSWYTAWCIELGLLFGIKISNNKTYGTIENIKTAKDEVVQIIEDFKAGKCVVGEEDTVPINKNSKEKASPSSSSSSNTTVVDNGDSGVG